MKVGKWLDPIVFIVCVIAYFTFFGPYMPASKTLVVGLALGASTFAIYWCIKSYVMLLIHKKRTHA